MFSEYKGCEYDETSWGHNSRRTAAESIDHRAHIVSKRIENRTSATGVDVFLHFRVTLVRRARGRDELNDFIGDQLHRFANLMFFSRPSQDATDLVKQVRTHSARFHYVRLLTQILRHQLSSIVQSA